jgi:hypothetical protein
MLWSFHTSTAQGLAGIFNTRWPAIATVPLIKAAGGHFWALRCSLRQADCLGLTREDYGVCAARASESRVARPSRHGPWVDEVDKAFARFAFFKA